MTLKEARKLKPGAIVREAWFPDAGAEWHGLVLAKEYVKERHVANMLSVWKDERYDVTVHWFKTPRPHAGKPSSKVRTHQSWEIMVISHVE
mgnify:FL=1|tara:strand:+ start:641 stop:913 length:273 start_codon:yes stop_codon:yes gene_type:complete